jgi:aminomethyltransferase
MKNATNAAGDLIDSLTLTANKVRQASITTELLDIVGGAEALRGFEPADALVPFAFTSQGIPRQDNPILVDGRPAGVVTSGTMSPCLEIGIGMGYVPLAAREPGTKIEVDVRGKLRPAEVRERPLYRKEQ